MRFVLLSAGQRWLLIVAVIALAVLAGWLGRRGRPRNAVLAGAGAALALGVLAAEVMIAWSIGWWAPEGAQFNEYRWVLLSPWGRVGIALGVACVVAIGTSEWSVRPGTVLASIRYGAPLASSSRSTRPQPAQSSA